MVVPPLLALATSALAASTGDAHELQHTGGWFLAGELVSSVAVGFLVPDLVLSAPPDPLTCADAWCGTNGFDVALNEALRARDHTRAIGHLSHGVTVGLVPAVVFGGVALGAITEGRGVHAAQDAVIVLDSFLVSTGFNSVAKVSARRQRPAFHYGREGATEAAGHEDEAFVSFTSGDTTWAFALAGSGTTLAFLRGHRLAPALGVTSGVLALTGGILRMSADMHWATDVLAGAVTGAAVGVGLPLLLHRRARRGPEIGVGLSRDEDTDQIVVRAVF